MECRQTQNMQRCNCSYKPCPRKGICCECVQYHLKMREIPACFFPNEVEKTYDRSFEKFANLVATGKI